MADEGFKRKLTAILSADVVGYSRLMRADEEATVRDLASNRVLITEIIQQHNGRVVDSPGDNILAEFASVVDAVNGAIKIQEEIKKSNERISEDRRMEFRIGINLGDVIEEDERIYGDGVNIAARVEGLAAGGGIAISGTVYEHIKEKLTLGYHYLGEQDVKNISEPIRVYRLLTEPADAGKIIGEKKPKSNKLVWAASGAIALLILVAGTVTIWNYYFRPSYDPASVEKMTFPLPEKPSIAVLPFDNMSADPAQDYIADGFTENIITGLSQIPEMFVIARNSVFTYKGKPFKIKQVSEELGVKYVLEGSIQKAGKRLRVNAQLIDALKGHHLWAERYDRELKDLFDLQDEVTLEILDAVQVKLVVGESPTLQGTENFEAWGHFVRGYGLLNRGTMEDILRARKHFEQAVKLDPNYAQAWANLGASHRLEVVIGASKSPAESIKSALEFTQKASELAGDQAYIHDEMIWIYMLQGQYDKAIAEGERAVALEPNGARSHIFLAMVLHYAKRPEEAIVHAKKAMRLEPYYQAWFLPPLAGAYEMVGRYDEAITKWKELLDRSLRGEFPPIYVHERLALNYARLDRMEGARAHAEEILKIKPDYTVEFFRKTTPYKDQKYLDSLVALLIKAGLPEHPPLKLPDKPSIAVLPFDNMSGELQQDYFSDGLTDQIISALSKIPHLFVIARNSTFTYKGKPVKVQQVAKELGVRYVLEGSVQKAQYRLRITAQLIDAQKGHHLWSESFDRDLKDIFAIQDEITMKVVLAMAVKLSSQEQARMYFRSTKNLKAYLKYLEAVEPFFLFTKESMARAKQLLEGAIALDPEYSEAYSFLGFCHYWDAVFGWSESPRKSIGRAYKLALKAMSIDDSLAQPHEMISKIYVFQKEYELAITEAQKTVELNPNGAWGVHNLGWVLRCAGKPEEGILWMEKSIRLNPLYLSLFTVFDSLGRAYFLAGRYEEAIAEYNKAIKLNPDYRDAHVGLAATYTVLGREKEARTEVSEILRIEPSFSIKKYSEFMSFQVGLESEIEGLRKAGLPE